MLNFKQNIESNEFENIEYKEKKIEIEKSFTKLFTANDYKQDAYFNSAVWFLSNDSTFQALRTNTFSDEKDKDKASELISDNKVYKLISYLSNNNKPNANNEEKSHSLNSNLSNIKVQVKQFIDSMTKLLIESQKTIDICDEQISNFKIQYKITAINQVLKKIETKKLKLNYYEERTSISKIIFYINKIEFFPEGEYSFILHLHEINSLGKLTTNSKRLNSKKKIKLTVPGQSVNLLHLNLQFKDISYSAIELNEINHKTIQSALKSDIANEVRMDFIDKDLKSKETNFSEEDKDDKDNFSFNNQASFESSEPVKFSISDCTGTSLTYFGMKIERNGEEFAYSNENFLDCLLLNIDDLLDLNKQSIITTFPSSAKVSKEIRKRLQLNIREFNVTLGMRMDLSMDLRYSILKRIYDVFMANITLKAYHEKIVNDTLDNYFPEIADKVKAILYPNPIKNEEVCCDKCLIF